MKRILPPAGARRVAQHLTISVLVASLLGSGCKTCPPTGTGAECPIPDAPSGLVATVQSPTQIGLTWQDQSKNESGFRIERAPSSTSSFSVVDSVWANVTTFQDGGVTEGTTYSYRVRAYNGAGASEPTNTQTITTPVVQETLTLTLAGRGSGSVGFSPGSVGGACTNPTSVSCTAVYDAGTIVTLTPTPGMNSAFAGWSGDCTGTGMCQVTMSQTRSVTAAFTVVRDTLTLTIAGTGSGSVGFSPGPVGGTCTNPTSVSCIAAFDGRTTATLTSQQATGSTLAGWSGDCTGTGTCQVTMSQARSVTATFTVVRDTLTLTIAGTGRGSVGFSSGPAGGTCANPTSVSCKAAYDAGTTLTLTPTPGANSAFAGWSGDCTGTGTCQVTMSQARGVIATFSETDTLTVSIIGNGTVTYSDPPGETCSVVGAGICLNPYPTGTVVTLTASPAAGWVFFGWSGDCSGMGTCQVTMSQPRNVTATFTVVRDTLTLTLAGTGSGSVGFSPGPAGGTCMNPTSMSCAVVFDAGVTVTLTSQPATGSAFAGWSGDCNGTGTCQVTMSQARSVTAIFNASCSNEPYSLSLGPKPVILEEGATAATTVAVKDCTGNQVSNAPVTYLSRDSARAAVSNSGNVSGITRGQAVVVATAVGGSSPSDSLLAVVAVASGPVIMTDITRFDYPTDTSLTVAVIVDMRASGETLGSAAVSVTWNPSLFYYQSYAAGSGGVTPTVDASRAYQGLLTVSMADANGFGGRVEIVKFTFRTWSSTSSGTLSLTPTEIGGAGTFSDLLPLTVAVSYPLRIR